MIFGGMIGRRCIGVYNRNNNVMNQALIVFNEKLNQTEVRYTLNLKKKRLKNKS